MGGGGSANPTNLPAGVIIPFGGALTIPKDTLICNGQSYKQTLYPDLFTAIGTVWRGSTAPPSDEFRVPDLRDRALYGVGSVVQPIGQTDGKPTGSRGGPTHSHNVSGTTGADGAHDHQFGAMTPDYDQYYGSYAPTFAAGSQKTLKTAPANPTKHTHSFSATVGSYDVDKPSFAVVQYLITTGVAPAS